MYISMLTYTQISTYFIHTSIYMYTYVLTYLTLYFCMNLMK